MRFLLPLIFVAAFPMAAAAREPVPTKEGQCVMTRIATIGTRLEGIADSGDQVTYTNGVLQVSYAAIKGLKGAKTGDAVKLCLTTIPDDCPPGDTRGKIYKATDLRTHQSWEDADSEHMCGGA
ncbi:MAG TPA: hypothetical protein VIJ85_10235 [Rhizomicrobium sp.]